MMMAAATLSRFIGKDGIDWGDGLQFGNASILKDDGTRGETRPVRSA